MAAAGVFLLLMAFNLYNGYSSIRGSEGVASILIIAIPLAAFGLAAYAHQKLKID